MLNCPGLSLCFLLSSSHRKWAAAHSALQKALQDEVPAEHPVPHGDRLQVFQDQAILYLKYLQIFRSLEEVYEQLVQPQKRRAVRMVLDGLTGRLLELKAQMVELDQSEFHYFDDLLLDLKMTPKDLEIPIPRYFLRDKMQLQRNRQMIDSINRFCGLVQVSSVQVMSLEEAIQLLQMSERARQGRIRAQFMKELIQSKRGIRRHTWRPSGLNPDQAAIQIQKVWRGFVQRRNTSRQRTEEMMFLGMVTFILETSAPSPVQLQGQWVSSSQRLIQDQNEEEYQRVQLSVKQSVLDVEGTDIKEALQDQIRQWFIECRDATGRFPEFPDEEDGGSASLFSQKTPEQVGDDITEGLAPVFFFCGVVLTDAWSGVSGAGSVATRERQEEEEGREGKEEEGEDRKKCICFFCLQVDELMRAELKNLKLVVDKTKTKAKKGNKKVSICFCMLNTPDGSLQSLCDELIMNGFLIQPQNVRLSEYIGEFSYLASTLRQANIEPTPSLSDVRQLVALYTVLPLGSQALLKKLPVAKSVLLAGPSGVGKKMLVQAICCETGAYLFHLSPTQLSHRYPGRGGATYLLHLVFKVAGELQPSVIWIEDAEKTFCKKKPKFDPRRLMKDLLKSLKTLKPEDRVLVIGTSRRPFDAEIKPFCKVYKKVILIPKPDYGSRLALWKELLRAQGAELGPSLDLSSLAKITDGFTPGHILSAVQSVLRPQRLKKLRLQPLTAAEFVPSLSRMDPVYREEEEAFKVWFSKTPLGRRKTRASKTNKEEKGGGKAGRKKKKDKMMTKKKKKK
uniref:Dynein regulatory complex protein 11-like n=1 Tax=Mastacembelus armatus TaxID=205130 RepID=A0A3Q3L2G4_9TELE